MKSANRSHCMLFLLTTSVAFSQSTTANAPQNMGNASASAGIATMSGDPTTEANLQKMEIELAQGDVARDPVPFTKYLDDDIIALGPGWSDRSKAEVLKDIQSGPCTTSNPTLTGFTYKWLLPDMVLVSYMLNQTETCNGKAMPGGDQHANSLWQRKNGKWVAVFHQTTAEVPNTMNGGN
jgi:hypothetical protein